MQYANFFIATVLNSRMLKSQQKVQILPARNKGANRPGKCGINVVFDISL